MLNKAPLHEKSIQIYHAPFCEGTRFRQDMNKCGFTFVESIIVAFIACSMMIIIQAFFSHGVRSTIKGSDTIESIRAASVLFTQMRKDLMACSFIETSGAITYMDVSATQLPDTATFSEQITFSTHVATITYFLTNDETGKKYVERRKLDISGTLERKKFGVPRMKNFETLKLIKQNKIAGAHWNPSQIIINVVVDSEDPRMPTKEIKLNSVFVSYQLAASNWNSVLFPAH